MNTTITKDELVQLINDALGADYHAREMAEMQIRNRVYGDLASLPILLDVVDDDNLSPNLRTLALILLKNSLLLGDLENSRTKWHGVAKAQRVSIKERVLRLLTQNSTALNHSTGRTSLAMFLGCIASAEHADGESTVVDDMVSLLQSENDSVVRAAMVAVVQFAERLSDSNETQSSELSAYFHRLLEAVAETLDFGDATVEQEASEHFRELLEVVPDDSREGLSRVLSALIDSVETATVENEHRISVHTGCIAALFRANRELARGDFGRRAIAFLLKLASSGQLRGATMQLAVDLSGANPSLIAPHLGLLLKVMTAVFREEESPEPNELLFNIASIAQLVEDHRDAFLPFALPTIDQLLELPEHILTAYSLDAEEFMPQIFIALAKLVKCDRQPSVEYVLRAKKIVLLSAVSISPVVGDEALIATYYAMRHALEVLNLFERLPDDEVAGILPLIQGTEGLESTEDVIQASAQQVLCALFGGGE